MGSEWRSSTWGDEVSLEYGKGLRDYKDNIGTYTVFGANGPVGKTNHRLADGPGVILGRKGAYRGVHFSEDPFYVIDTAYFIKPKKKMDMRWLYYAARYYNLGNLDDGSPIPSTTRSAVYAQELKVPQFSEQQAIAHILGTLDDKIELNGRINETLEGMARALFKSWFIDFDPVRAKAEGRDTGLPQEIDDIFPDEFVDSELGEIPKGWEVKSLDELAKFLNGLALQKYPAENDQEYLPVVKIAQLRSGNTLNSDRASMRVPPDYVVNDGDILFSWSGSLECVVWSGGKGALNQHLFKATPLESLPRWLCFYAVHLHLPGFRQIAAGKATTMGHIQRRHLSDAKLAVPCRKALDAMNPIFSPMFERSSWQLNIESRSLALLRDTLLPKLISGEIRVEDAEKFLEVRMA